LVTADALCLLDGSKLSCFAAADALFSLDGYKPFGYTTADALCLLDGSKLLCPSAGRRAVLARRPFAVVFGRRRRAALARRLQAVVQGRRLTRCAR